jgi:release factor glutamine methyltransferase
VSERQWTVVPLIQVTSDYLAGKGVATPRLDAEVLLAEALGLPRRLDLYLQHDKPVARGELSGYRELVRRRAGGEPVAYLLGRAAFYDEELEVCADVLVPRPETELLVEAALARLGDEDAASGLDIGTGSGAIPIAVCRKRPGVRFTATDVSPRALAVARRNFQRYELEARVTPVLSDLFAALPEEARFDLIVSNPPYVAEGDPALEEPVARFEPALALYGGADGLDVVRRLLEGAAHRLAQGGALLMELGAGQAPAVQQEAEARGYRVTAVRKDLAGIERVVELER